MAPYLIRVVSRSVLGSGRFPTEDLAGSHKFSESEEENFKEMLPGATSANQPIDWQQRADQWMAVPAGANARIAGRQIADIRQVYTVAGIPPDPDGGPPLLNVRTGPGANFPSLFLVCQSFGAGKLGRRLPDWIHLFSGSQRPERLGGATWIRARLEHRLSGLSLDCSL
jgi:hypothetical protein